MKRIVFDMLNPSSAGWPDGDLTVTKVCGFAARIADRDPLEVHTGGAVFSEDRLYRFRLWRELKEPREHLAYDELVRVDVVNLSAWISTDPAGLYRCSAPFSPENLRHVAAAVSQADVVVAAWGSLASLPAWFRAEAEVTLSRLTRTHDVMCLGRTKDGAPLHPSRLPYAAQLELYRPRRSGH